MTAKPLDGLKVVDTATLLAGPLIATLLGDYGADVVKVEHPKGDALRSFGWVKDGVSLWWLFVNRNKACVSLRLSDPAGAAILKELVADADNIPSQRVIEANGGKLIERFRKLAEFGGTESLRFRIYFGGG